MLLLDTHILLWILREPSRVKPSIRELLERHAEDLMVSTLSLIEISHKQKIGKLDVQIDLEDLDFFDWLDIRREHIRYTSRLPLIFRDPFDRLLIAQSIVEKMPLVTADGNIHQYDFNYIRA